MIKRLIMPAMLTSVMWFSQSVFADTESSYTAPLAAKSLLLDITHVSEHKLIAVGERGHILLSDNGQDWQQQAVPTQVTLTAVFFIDAQHGWAVGYDATILATQDGGKHWQKQFSDAKIQKPFMDVTFFDRQNGIAIGAYGLFYRTADGGAHWQPEAHSELLSQDDRDYLDDLKKTDPGAYQSELSAIMPHFNHLSAWKNGQMFLAGEAGLLARSTDQGHHWQRIDVHYQGSLFTVEQMSDGSVLAAGLRGHVFEKSADQQQWHNVPNDGKASYNGIVDLGDNHWVLVGNSGTLLSIKGDKTSVTHTAQGKAIVAAVANSGKLILATESGIQSLSSQ